MENSTESSTTARFAVRSYKERVRLLTALCESQGYSITPPVADTIVQSIAAGQPQVDALGVSNGSFEAIGTALALKVGDLIIQIVMRTPFMADVEITLPGNWEALTFPELEQAQRAFSACDAYARGTPAEEMVIRGYGICDQLLQPVPGMA